MNVQPLIDNRYQLDILSEEVERQVKAQTQAQSRELAPHHLTPWPVARMMSHWILKNKPKTVINPNSGLQIFARAAWSIFPETCFESYEPDPELHRWSVALASSVGSRKLKPSTSDWLSECWTEELEAIVSSPPAKSSFKLSDKTMYQDLSYQSTGTVFSLQSSLQSWFILKTLAQLSIDGRAALLLFEELCPYLEKILTSSGTWKYSIDLEGEPQPLKVILLEKDLASWHVPKTPQRLSQLPSALDFICSSR